MIRFSSRSFIAVPVDTNPGEMPNDTIRLSEHFGEAPHFVILAKNVLTGHVSVETYLENPFREIERQKGVRVAELLADHEVDETVTRACLTGKGSGYTLEALQIAYSRTSSQTLPELVAQIAGEQ